MSSSREMPSARHSGRSSRPACGAASRKATNAGSVSRRFSSHATQAAGCVSRTIQANFANSNSVTLADSDFVGVGKAVRIREIDVCNNGVAKKMLILASTPY